MLGKELHADLTRMGRVWSDGVVKSCFYCRNILYPVFFSLSEFSLMDQFAKETIAISLEDEMAMVSLAN